MSANFVAHGVTIPPELPEILKDLNREILRHQPADITLFCANYFQRKLKEKQSNVLEQLKWRIFSQYEIKNHCKVLTENCLKY